jgi:translation initiation factor 1
LCNVHNQYKAQNKPKNQNTPIQNNPQLDDVLRHSTHQLLIEKNKPKTPKTLIYISCHFTVDNIMAEVCSTCGLPKDLCVCGEIEKEQQRIRIRLETRKFGRSNTIIDGMDDKNSNLTSIAQKLKTYCACGGTHKNGLIMLQGDHRDRVKDYLVKIGYPQENIEVQ